MLLGSKSFRIDPDYKNTRTRDEYVHDSGKSPTMAAKYFPVFVRRVVALFRALPAGRLLVTLRD
jgi:hypothetical protein